MKFYNGTEINVFDSEKVLNKTIDGGATWTRYAESTAVDDSPLVMHWRGANKGWMQLSNQDIYRTTDGGITWTNLAPPSKPRRMLWLDAFSDTHLVCAGLVDEYWVSMDGGSTWTRGAFPGGSGTRPGVISTANRNAYMTTDGGTSWVRISENAAGYGYKFDETTGAIYAASFASGNNALLSRSTDDGATWEAVARSCGAGRGAGLTPSGKYVYLTGDGGHIERHLTADLVSTRRQRVATPSLATFPNPTSGELSIDLPFSNQPTTLEVFSAYGRRVQTSVAPAGTERFRFVIENQKMGLYLLSWRNANGVHHTGRVMVR